MPGRSCTPAVLVLGVGNLLMSDDGAGVHALRAVKARADSGVMAVEAGTAIVRIQHLLERHERIIVLDALRGGGRVGSVYVTTLDQISNDHPGDSLHNLSLASLMRMSGLDPAEVVVVAAEPGVIEIGLDLTPEVRDASERMAAAALKIAAMWQRGGSAGSVVAEFAAAVE